MKTLSILAVALALAAAAGSASASTYGGISVGEGMLPHASLPSVHVGVAHRFHGGVIVGVAGGGGSGDGIRSQGFAASIQTPSLHGPMGARMALVGAVGGAALTSPGDAWVQGLYTVGGVVVGVPISAHTSVSVSLASGRSFSASSSIALPNWGMTVDSTGSGRVERASIGATVAFTPRVSAVVSDAYFRLDAGDGAIRSHRIALSLVERF